jgi:Carboxypeptidase regulatory-like domain
MTILSAAQEAASMGRRKRQTSVQELKQYFGCPTWSSHESEGAFPSARAIDPSNKRVEARAAPIVEYGQMVCSAISAGRRRVAALAFTLVAAMSPRARAAELPVGFQLSRLGPESYHLVVTVKDETGVAVPSARATLSRPGSQTPLQASTDFAGRAEFTGVAAGVYSLSVEKEGFYAQLNTPVQVEKTESVDVTLPHQQEYKESVQVNYSPPAIDPAQTSASRRLTAQEIIEIPYPSTRDIRNALPLLPGVLPDNSAPGQVHVAGAASNETLYSLDGFDIGQPVSGLLDLRVSTDAVRSVDVLTSRYSVASGWGSGGLLSLETGMGDDHFRFFATDFVPSFQDRRGFHIDNTTPRFTFSGPIRKGKVWFYEAVEGEYDYNLFPELPPGQDTDHYWRYSNLIRTQVNLTQGNRLTASYIYNHSNEEHAGLSIIQPLSTTTSQIKSVDLFDVKDQNTWSNGMLFEAGFAFLQFNADALPLGTLPYVELPGSASGNYYLTSSSTVRRYEGLANLYFPAVEWHGRHEFLLGTAFERTSDRQFAVRQPFTIQSATDVLVRSVSFSGSPSFEQDLLAGSFFLQDRWSPVSSLLLEPGMRYDEDDLIPRALLSPRVAATWMITRDNQTKLSAGAGLYYDRTDLDKLTRPLAGGRQDVFYAPDGVTALGPAVTTMFQADRRELRVPHFLNWSIALERKLPAAIYWKAEFMEKRGYDGFDYVDEGLVVSPNGLPSSGLFTLQNGRRDQYDALTLSFRHTFQEHYPLFFSYTRSKARSNAVLDSTLDQPFYSPQLPGPLPWDSPNRVQSWGTVPFRLPWIHALELEYSFDWRTGYPYNLINVEQQLVGLPGQVRFPDFASLNPHVEKRFHLFGFEWALRGGFNNITNRQNPLIVNNNIDSPAFGEFGDFQHRAFTGRIRFLGRK